LTIVWTALFSLWACEAVAITSTSPHATDLVLTDAHQFSYVASLTPTLLEFDLEQEVQLDWSALREDVYGRPMPATAAHHEAWIFQTRGDGIDELFDAMANEQLDQAAISLFTTCASDHAGCGLREFRLLDGANDVPERMAASDAPWGLVVVNPDDGGMGLVHRVTGAASGGLIDARLTDPSPIAVTMELGDTGAQAPVGVPALTVDWAGVAANGAGDSLAADKVDELFVIQTGADLATLETNLFHLDEIADASWHMPLIRQVNADLTLLEGETPFEGVDRSGTWLLGLGCTSCTTPAPRLLTVLEPVE
jgi:hypothetical protein